MLDVLPNRIGIIPRNTPGACHVGPKFLLGSEFLRAAEMIHDSVKVSPTDGSIFEHIPQVSAKEGLGINVHACGALFCAHTRFFVRTRTLVCRRSRQSEEGRYAQSKNRDSQNEVPHGAYSPFSFLAVPIWRSLFPIPYLPPFQRAVWWEILRFPTAKVYMKYMNLSSLRAPALK